MAVLVTVFVVMSLAIVVSKGSVDRLRQQRYYEWKLQARWLAVSALERAAAQIDADPDYRGETWRPDPQYLAGQEAGEVQITVNEEGRIDVVARFPHERVDGILARAQAQRK